MNSKSFLPALAGIATACALLGCATETSHSVQVLQVPSAGVPYASERTPVAIGKFDNRSSFMRGFFSDGIDRLGGQAKTVLLAHLQQSNRFTVLERENLAEMQQEVALKGGAARASGADYLVTGDVTEFGRKETGDQQLFGIFGRGRAQTSYAKVTLNVVDVRTSEVVHSVQGAGEYQLDTREVIGFGGTASYDATLNGKVLDLAIREAVGKLVVSIDFGAWRVKR